MGFQSNKGAYCSRRERNAVISDVALTIFIIAIAAILSFIIVSLRRGNARLIHKLYFILAAGLMIWLAALIGIRLTDPNHMDMMFIWDSITYVGGPFGTAWMVLISLVFVKGLDHLPRRYLLFFDSSGYCKCFSLD